MTNQNQNNNGLFVQDQKFLEQDAWNILINKQYTCPICKEELNEYYCLSCDR